MTGVSALEVALAVVTGITLAAACGFRVFVPLLALGIAARTGLVHLAPGAMWIATTPALVVLATATVAEILAYKIPWLDHLLDTIATPAAILAGVIAAAAVLPDLPSWLRWSVALVGGGGAAGVTQGSTVLLRLKSSALTAGLANPFLALGELAGAVTTSILALLAPVVCLVLLVGLAVYAAVRWRRREAGGR